MYSFTIVQTTNLFDLLISLRILQGAEIDVRSIVVGDETMSVLEIWGAEYQEQVHWSESVFYHCTFSRFCVNLNYIAQLF